MRRLMLGSVLSLQILMCGHPNAGPFKVPPLPRFLCDPLPCMAPGHQRPEPFYVTDARCVMYLDRDSAEPRFYAGAVVRLSETEEGSLLENTFLSLRAEYDNVFSAVRCDDSPDARCHVVLFADVELKGRRVEILGSQGMVDLAEIGFDNQVSSLKITCDVRKTPK